MNIPERISKIVNSNDDLVGKCVDIVWLAKDNSEVFNHLDLFSNEINESLKKYSRYCNHPDEQPLHSTMSLVGEHRWSEEERKKYYKEEDIKKFKVYQKLFKHYFPNEDLPTYDRLRLVSKVRAKVKEGRVNLYCFETVDGGSPITDDLLFVQSGNEKIYFKILSHDWYREETEDQKKRVNSVYVTDIDINKKIDPNSCVYIDRRKEKERV